MAPVLLDSETDSSDEELFAQHPGQQNFKLKPPSRPLTDSSEPSAFRPIRPQNKVLGVRMGQYRDETSSSEEELDFNSPPTSPGSSLEESTLVDLRPTAAQQPRHH